ncbi:hypothetical protein D3C73_516440 [compost metagenome]
MRSSSFSGTLVVPLKAMCSMKWARPNWSSFSIREPAAIRRRSDAWPGGVAFFMMA